MQPPKVFKISEGHSTPWKNGQGSTVQLAIFPEGSTLEANNFFWRVSMATITASGPFSKFAGYDRALVQISGGPIRLGLSESARTRFLQPMKPHYFQGERALQCVVDKPPAIDVNAMVDRQWGTLKMTPFEISTSQNEIYSSEASFVHVFVVDAGIAINFENSRLVLNRHEMLSFENDLVGQNELTLNFEHLAYSSGGKVIVIELTMKV